jgi:hypothetical protein
MPPTITLACTTTWYECQKAAIAAGSRADVRGCDVPRQGSRLTSGVRVQGAENAMARRGTEPYTVFVKHLVGPGRHYE